MEEAFASLRPLDPMAGLLARPTEAIAYIMSAKANKIGQTCDPCYSTPHLGSRTNTSALPLARQSIPGPVTLRSDDALAQALNLHRANNQPDSAVAYQPILASDPTNPAAEFLLGTVSYQTRQLAAATGPATAITLDPQRPHFHIDRSSVLQGLGDFDHCMTSLRRALIFDRSNVSAWHKPANAAHMRERAMWRKWCDQASVTP